MEQGECVQEINLYMYPIKTHAVPLWQVSFVVTLECVGKIHSLLVVGVHCSWAGPDLVHVPWHSGHTLHQSCVPFNRHHTHITFIFVIKKHCASILLVIDQFSQWTTSCQWVHSYITISYIELYDSDVEMNEREMEIIHVCLYFNLSSLTQIICFIMTTWDERRRNFNISCTIVNYIPKTCPNLKQHCSLSNSFTSTQNPKL